jgi:hypothetical protein
LNLGAGINLIAPAGFYLQLLPVWNLDRADYNPARVRRHENRTRHDATRFARIVSLLDADHQTRVAVLTILAGHTARTFGSVYPVLTGNAGDTILAVLAG